MILLPARRPPLPPSTQDAPIARQQTRDDHDSPPGRGQCIDPSPRRVGERRPAIPVSGDVGRVAVAAERAAVLSRATGERWSTAAFTTRGANPTHHTSGACRMHAAQGVAGATPLTAVRGGAYSWKWDDHAHQIHLPCCIAYARRGSPCGKPQTV